MVGFPMLSGFISKLLFATSALQSPHKMMFTIIGLAVSTILNAVYFLRLVITLYARPKKKESLREAGKQEERVKKACESEGDARAGKEVGNRKETNEAGNENAAGEQLGKQHISWGLGTAICGFILLNLFLGMMSQPVVQAIANGLAMFD